MSICMCLVFPCKSVKTTVTQETKIKQSPLLKKKEKKEDGNNRRGKVTDHEKHRAELSMAHDNQKDMFQ